MQEDGPQEERLKSRRKMSLQYHHLVNKATSRSKDEIF